MSLYSGARTLKIQYKNGVSPSDMIYPAADTYSVSAGGVASASVTAVPVNNIRRFRVPITTPPTNVEIRMPDENVA